MARPAIRSGRRTILLPQSPRPEGWATFNTQTLLGGALLGQKKYAEAEPLLLRGYAGMKRHWEASRSAAEQSPGMPEGKGAGHPDATTRAMQQQRLADNLERLAQLYEAWNQTKEATKWRKERDLLPVVKGDLPQK